ncbi:DgyrCDS13655 [Dimorphilus gyrociliatus]|uniref:DgyrCDS13650 n=1 Tax=Dimorphilus gyrociliatus TaxID=2664684 RepID=A0A7I8WBC1_9ANNE|nr:DgyrCDS13650 [Dimorphilus gyrociliatus]CAD5125432.1 DgyrCDS13655 [Dimorphilus gyrociliatus]
MVDSSALDEKLEVNRKGFEEKFMYMNAQNRTENTVMEERLTAQNGTYHLTNSTKESLVCTNALLIMVLYRILFRRDNFTLLLGIDIVTVRKDHISFYMDDLILVGNNEEELENLTLRLHQVLAAKD